MKLKLKDITVLSLLAALMISSDLLMDFLPNVHIVGVLIVCATVVYRVYALLPIYVYVFLQGTIGGFSAWWFGYLYIWAVLWGAVMLIPQRLPQGLKTVLYITVCALHGFLFSVLYAPAQALFFGYDLNQTIAWIISGFIYADWIHGTANFVLGAALIYPITKILKNTDKFAKRG